MAAASGIEPDSDSLTARRIALMLDRKINGAGCQNRTGLLCLEGTGPATSPIPLSHPRLLNNSGDLVSGEGKSFGSPGATPGAARSTSYDPWHGIHVGIPAISVVLKSN